ncbi:Crp/Fnr family transcriptional regulator [Vibrio genomosp. F10 str. 9ZC157]|uniref:Crp/Fnr family transcriptional regulator n=1 Tax=Vibrio genomosp. F10 TaxID=723171 RepID=UPI0002D8A766|nr:Crp/Fnr family transcriptional regulator [Vibrio genomosp. F10]OEE94650.1 Crp/Fnr family transcriptional regulator [Vibrio genomosp. F10 str. 9ZC157]
MTERFITYLTEQQFSSTDIDALVQSSSLLELPTRHILVNQGELADGIYFVLEGICHGSYLTDKGKEFSKEFYWEQDWMIGFESVIKAQPSPYLLETLTPTLLVHLPIDVLHHWRSEKHSVYLTLLESQLMFKESKERFMLLFTPRERYELFCQHYPELLTRLNDYQIAAYLGITAISLSRIKNTSQ